MFRPHMDHHQATLIIGETTALYTLSSVPLGISLFLSLVSIVGYIHRILGGYFSLFILFTYVVYALVLSSLLRVKSVCIVLSFTLLPAKYEWTRRRKYRNIQISSHNAKFVSSKNASFYEPLFLSTSCSLWLTIIRPLLFVTYKQTQQRYADFNRGQKFVGSAQGSRMRCRENIWT
jgi:hypothetical protein